MLLLFFIKRGRYFVFFFFSSRTRHTRWNCDWSSDVCSSDLVASVTCLKLRPTLLSTSVSTTHTATARERRYPHSTKSKIFSSAMPGSDGATTSVCKQGNQSTGSPTETLRRLRILRAAC